MHRTQVYLEESQYEMLKTRARREGKTLAAVIRDLLDSGLRGGPAGRDPFDDVIGIAKGDGLAVAENHAEYLYGDKQSGRK